jgi:ubiquinone/menaquinone biosynthesis C-methylase UbiE
MVFETGKAETLPHPDASFDGALAARLFLHVSEPETVLLELLRVVKPGGRIVAMDWDFETVTVDHPDRELTRRLLHWRNDHHGGNNWSGRQLWRLFQSAGLQNLSVHPWVSIAHGDADGLTQSLWRAAQVACASGAISQIEQETWVRELKEHIHAGTFFASVVYFIIQGTAV